MSLVDQTGTKRIARFGAQLCTLLVVAGVLSSCSTGSSRSTAPSTASSTTGSKGGNHTLVVDTAFVVKTLDPDRDNNPTSAMVFHQVYETLLTYSNGNNTSLVPDLATSYTANSSLTQFTFHLRTGVRFSDGTPLTSADVVFSLMRLKYLLAPNSNVMKGVVATAPNASTVVLTSTKPYPSLPEVMTFEATGVLNSKAVIAHGGTDSPNAASTDRATAWLSSHSAGSGPYELNSANLSSQIVLTRNPNYWGTTPVYGRVVLQNVSSSSQQRLDVTSGAANIATNLGGTSAANLPSNVYMTSDVPDRDYLLQFNMNPAVSAVSSNADFREAVRYALNYKQLMALAPIVSAPLPSVIPPGFPGGLPAADATQQNLTLAKQALARSGLKNPTIQMLYIGNFTYDGVNFDNIVQAIQAELAAVGITLQLDPTTSAAFVTAIASDKVAMFFGPRRARYVDMSGFNFFGPGQPFGRQSNYTAANADPAVVSALQTAETSLSLATRTAAYATFQTALITSNGPYVPLFATKTLFVASDSVTNLKPVAAGWYITFSELGYK